MTALLASPPSRPLPDPVASLVKADARDFAPRTPTQDFWHPTSDAPRVPQVSIQGTAFQESPHVKVRFLDPASAFARQLETALRDLLEAVEAYDDRISALEEYASIEGYSLNSHSKETFLEFFKNNPLTKVGGLFLHENGNLRAVWKGDGPSHVGLQFLENGLIQYVLFKRRHAAGPTSRAYGRDTPSGVLAQISALKLEQVLYR